MLNKHKSNLDKIFHPRSVAIVGASPDSNPPFAFQVIQALRENGFPAIYPVNPRRSEVLGLPCYSTISDIPGKVDHVLVSIAASKALELLDDCARKGVNSVHFFTAGFSESGEREGIELEKKMLEKARSGGFRIIGPNCTGLYVPKAKFIPSPSVPVEPGRVAFISQSGGHAEQMPRHAGTRGIRFSKVISYGNAIDIDECELLEYLAGDDETEIISIYIEGVRDGKRFAELLKEAAAKKPVVIYKGGITDAGLRSAQGHTASLTSSVKVFQALCHQTNAIMVNDIHEMVDVLVALSFATPYPTGKGVGGLGQGGGATVQLSDLTETAGLKFPTLTNKIADELRTFLVLVGAIIGNPLDASNLVDPQTIYRTMKVLGKSPDINMIMYHIGLHPATRWGQGRFANDLFLRPAVECFRKANDEIQKPVLLAMGMASDKEGIDEMFYVRDAFVKAEVPVFYEISTAALAMSRVVDWHSRFDKKD
ncbi:MAG: CoA-binding protein [Dehalococcoidales bacterium]|nr:CoA-binding protein [Dehalococcoidales bacterium]